MPLSVRFRSALSLAALCLTTLFTIAARAQAPAAAPAPVPAAPSGVELVRATYTKFEYMVPMRDGARLFTAVYVPKDVSQPYPFLITRTPYSVAPYGVDQYRDALGPVGALPEGRLHLRLPGRARPLHVGRGVPAGAAVQSRARGRRTSTRAPTPTTRSSGC